jgi:hypothetical protein
MVKPYSVYRKHTIKKFGIGKKVVFTTIFNAKEWSALTESEIKRAIDVWIDEGLDPQQSREN